MELKFNSSEEKLPKHHSHILYIEIENSVYFDDEAVMTHSKCEWCWSDGDGMDVCHAKEFSLNNPPKDFPYLSIIDHDGFIIWTNDDDEKDLKTNHFWWMYKSEFNKILKNSKH